MAKANKIIYWIANAWLSLGMISTAVVQVFRLKASADFITHLGYPVFFLTILGIWKILGVIAVLIPKFPLLKEWAYAGFFLLCPERHYHISRRVILSMNYFHRYCFYC